MQMIEIWRPVVGYEESHLVSSKGRVKSITRQVRHKDTFITIKSKMMTVGTDTYGYGRVNLRANCKSVMQKVHRLVAKAFIENPESKITVNHKNGVKKDNRVENLEWATYSENNFHSYRVLGKKPPILGVVFGDNAKSKIVIQMTIDGDVIKEWDSISRARDEGGFISGQISRCCNGKSQTHRKFKWRFKNEAKYF